MGGKEEGGRTDTAREEGVDEEQCEEPRACGELLLERMLTLQLPGCARNV